MLFLETDLAIYKRLVGFPIDAQGRPLMGPDGLPQNREVIGPPDLNPMERVYDAMTDTFTPLYPTLPSYGIRVPITKPPFRGQRGLTSKDPAAVRMFTTGFEPATFRQVLVFDENITGRKWEDVWPCVTFRWMGQEFEPKTFMYHDPFAPPDAATPVDLKNRLNDTIESGFGTVNVRPHPEAWNAMYAITAYAKEMVELQLICAEIMKLFPAKGALTITFASGEQHTCDMLLQRVETLDDGGNEVLLTHGPEEQRGFRRSFIYLIETYYDNTTNQFGVQGSPLAIRPTVTIQQRLFELDDIMTGLANQPSHDINLDELSPIT